LICCFSAKPKPSHSSAIALVVQGVNIQTIYSRQ
jgi:hypothetical protein